MSLPLVIKAESGNHPGKINIAKQNLDWKWRNGTSEGPPRTPQVQFHVLFKYLIFRNEINQTVLRERVKKVTSKEQERCLFLLARREKKCWDLFFPRGRWRRNRRENLLNLNLYAWVCMHSKLQQGIENPCSVPCQREVREKRQTKWDESRFPRGLFRGQIWAANLQVNLLKWVENLRKYHQRLKKIVNESTIFSFCGVWRLTCECISEIEILAQEREESCFRFALDSLSLS